MNKLIGLLLILAAHHTYAQQGKTAGGCHGTISIDTISTPNPNARCVFVGDTVFATVRLSWTDCMSGAGYVELLLGSQLVAREDLPDVFAHNPVTIPF